MLLKNRKEKQLESEQEEQRHQLHRTGHIKANTIYKTPSITDAKPKGRPGDVRAALFFIVLNKQNFWYN